MLLIFCACCVAWYSADGREAGVARAGAMGAEFAVGDFDGDSLPDLATVQAGAAEASRTKYWIHFSFSAGTQGLLAVSAPAGGLQIASRDVNGDSFLDLIVSTRLANELVAVLLNDGRGNFHLADAEAFGTAIWEALQAWRANAAESDDGEPAIAGAGWSAAIFNSKRYAGPPGAMARVAVTTETIRYFILPHEDLGRAPPAA
jgi:hypothetical protein